MFLVLDPGSRRIGLAAVDDGERLMPVGAITGDALDPPQPADAIVAMKSIAASVFIVPAYHNATRSAYDAFAVEHGCDYHGTHQAWARAGSASDRVVIVRRD